MKWQRLNNVLKNVTINDIKKIKKKQAEQKTIEMKNLLKEMVPSVPANPSQLPFLCSFANLFRNKKTLAELY